MRLHPREEIVRKASLDIEEAVVYANVAASPSSPLKYALRMERHGDDNEPASLE